MLAGLVALWSRLAGLTAAASTFVGLLVVRFLFGGGEAGAQPAARKASVPQGRASVQQLYCRLLPGS